MGSVIDTFNDTFLGGAEKEAGMLQERAAARAEALQRERMGETSRQFDITQEQFAPYREAGGRALTAQEALTGTLGVEAQQKAYDELTLSPGQSFLRNRQEQSLLRNQAAIGGLQGGNVRTALQEQATGFAQQDIQNQLARLSALRTSGQDATAGLGAGRAGMVDTQNQITNNIGGYITQGAQARASGILGQAAQRRAFEEQQYQRYQENMSSFGGGMMGGG